jgi:hypothetical protein
VEAEPSWPIWKGLIRGADLMESVRECQSGLAEPTRCEFMGWKGGTPRGPFVERIRGGAAPRYAH